MALALALVAAVACSDETPLPTDIDQDFAFECTVHETEFFIGASLDGIPALTDPQLVPIIDPGTAHLFDYLKDDDRVVSLELNGLAIAVPLRILWYHEIVNLDLAGESVAITHCPLTQLAAGTTTLDLGLQNVEGLGRDFGPFPVPVTVQ